MLTILLCDKFKSWMKRRWWRLGICANRLFDKFRFLSWKMFSQFVSGNFFILLKLALKSVRYVSLLMFEIDSILLFDTFTYLSIGMISS